MPRPTNPEIPKYLAPESKERDTTYQKTKKQKGENKVLRSVSLSFPQGAPVIQNTKYASLFRRLGSLIRTNVLRIQSDQLASKENLPGNILPEFCLELRSPSPHRTRQKGQQQRRAQQRNSGQDEKRAIKRKTPNPTKPTKRLREYPAETTPCWDTRVNPLRMWADNTRPRRPEDTEEHGS